MKYFSLVRADIKSAKGSFIGILTLVFMITLSLCAVISIWLNANDYEIERIESVGYGDLTYWVADVADMETLLGQIEAIDEVEKAEAEDIVEIRKYSVYGQGQYEEGTATLLISEWEKVHSKYHIFCDNLAGINQTPESPADGEIYVPSSFSSLYNAQIGDEVVIVAEDGEKLLSYTIKGYFEDPVAGSAMMGMKQVLMPKADMQKLAAKVEEAEENTFGENASMIHISMVSSENLTVGQLQTILGERTDLSKYSLYAYSKASMVGFMLVLQNIFSGFLLLFVLILLVVAMIIISHNISSSIEQDYVDMGILKAMGYTRRDLQIVQLLQYLIAIVGGMLPGIPAAVWIVRIINKMTVSVVGLLIPEELSFGMSLCVLGIILLIIMGFICIKTVKIGQIAPIRAIRGGAEDVYFKSRLTAPICKRGLNFWLAYRQLVSGKKQYISICLITALLVFLFSLMIRMDAWMGPDGKGLMDSFSATYYDLGIAYYNQDVQEEVEKMLEESMGISASYQSEMTRGFMNGVEYIMNVVSAPEYYNVIEGRSCLYRNEAVVTQSVADELHIGIGDTVWITCEGKEADFIISGIYQCANDMGENFGVNREGYEQLAEGDDVLYWTCYLFREPSAVKEAAELLRNQYGEGIATDEHIWSGTDAILVVMSALMALMDVITLVFIFVTVLLTGSKILYREKHDMGIYKSLGFTSGRLRTAFALRFGIVASAGSALGIVLSACLTDFLATAILKPFGISHFESEIDLFQMMLPAAAVCALFLAFAYFSAGRVKKVEPRILVVE